MPSVIKEQDFGLVPISEETLAEYYLNILNEIEEQYHKLPEVAILDFKFKTSSGEVRFEFPFALSATERTTKEQRKDTFATIIHIMSRQTEWAGLNLHIRLDFKIEPDQ